MHLCRNESRIQKQKPMASQFDATKAAKSGSGLQMMTKEDLDEEDLFDDSDHGDSSDDEEEDEDEDELLYAVSQRQFLLLKNG